MSQKANGQFTFCSTLEETIPTHDGEISDSESDGEMVPVPVDEKPQEKWDCESILSKACLTLARLCSIYRIEAMLVFQQCHS